MASGKESGKSTEPGSIKPGKKKKTITSRGIGSARKATQAEADGLGEAELPVWLVRSAVYRRIPVGVRTKLDRAIIFRPQGLATIEAIAGHFGLAEKFGVSVAEVAAYADKVEQLVRPEVTSHVLAGVLGCLPSAYRKRIVAGSEVLLISRVLSAINSEQSGLTVAEMAKLASVLLSLARRSEQASVGRGQRGKGSSQACDELGAGGQDPIKLAESVRLLYGLELPQVDAEHRR